ncbi:MAG: 50S ribosomal protein L17 [Candidatus Cloacimonetes bacterium]|nr:50S ribosomal protein L17 [Candidatus Cloacimonadota bacterium]
MRHRIEGRNFGREADPRRLMMRNLVKSIIDHGRITTTLAKAKEMRRFVERVITYGKKNTVHARRLAYSVLGDRDLVKKVFDEIAPAMNDRNGGYTRVLKAGFRKGDSAPLAIIEFVVETAKPETKPKKDKIKAKDLAK